MMTVYTHHPSDLNPDKTRDKKNEGDKCSASYPFLVLMTAHNAHISHPNVRVKKAIISPYASFATTLSESCPSSIINPCGSPW